MIKIFKFLNSDIIYAWLRGIYRFFSYIIESFFLDDCYSKASAIAFNSLLSIVPILAVIFGIAQGFGFEKVLEDEISKNFFQQPEISDKLTRFAHSWLQSVQGGVVAGMGTIFLFWSVISLLNNVENSLNEIWKVQKGRSFAHKIRDYLTIFFIAPLFFVTASSLNIYLITELTETAQNYMFVEAISPYLLFVLKLSPFFLIWILFTFIYAFIPNTEVKIRDAFIAGVSAGTAFQVWQWIYIHFQVKLSTYGAIYGSFAALPLFLIWLQFSWLIFLAGAEIAARIKDGFLKYTSHSIAVKTAGLSVVYLCSKAFSEGNPPPTNQELQQKLGISPKNLQDILKTLSKNRILSEAFLADNNFGYLPARPIEDISIQMVCDAVEQSYEIPATVDDNIELQKIENLISTRNKMIVDSLGNKSLYALVTEKNN